MATLQDLELFEQPRPPARPARWWDRPLPLPVALVCLVAWSYVAYLVVQVTVGWLS